MHVWAKKNASVCMHMCRCTYIICTCMHYIMYVHYTNVCSGIDVWFSERKWTHACFNHRLLCLLGWAVYQARESLKESVRDYVTIATADNYTCVPSYRWQHNTIMKLHHQMSRQWRELTHVCKDLCICCYVYIHVHVCKLWSGHSCKHEQLRTYETTNKG